MRKNNRRPRLAIIGASTGQVALCVKAREIGVETWCFAWERGAVCRNLVDHFMPISITERDRITELCEEAEIDGVVTNGSDATTLVAAYVASHLGLPTTPYSTLCAIGDKSRVRKLTNGVDELCALKYNKASWMGRYPCVVKPCRGTGKLGVSFARDAEQMAEAVAYAGKEGEVLVEEYVEGRELSVESISCRGKHYVVQVTDKVSGPAPHFVELAHHQPADLSPSLRAKIERVVPRILTAIGFTDGATHTELKHDGTEVYLIEVNLRGGGDEISNRLTFLSSGIDYVRCMIDVALGRFSAPMSEHEPRHSGILYLCRQTASWLPLFKSAAGKPWCVECVMLDGPLHESHSNWERDGWLIYQADNRICPNQSKCSDQNS